MFKRATSEEVFEQSIASQIDIGGAIAESGRVALAESPPNHAHSSSQQNFFTQSSSVKSLQFTGSSS